MHLYIYNTYPQNICCSSNVLKGGGKVKRNAPDFSDMSSNNFKFHKSSRYANILPVPAFPNGAHWYLKVKIYPREWVFPQETNESEQRLTREITPPQTSFFNSHVSIPSDLFTCEVRELIYLTSWAFYILPDSDLTNKHIYIGLTTKQHANPVNRR